MRWGPSRLCHLSPLRHAFGWSERSEKMLPMIQQSQPSPSSTRGAPAPWAFSAVGRGGGDATRKEVASFHIGSSRETPESPGRPATPSFIPPPSRLQPLEGGCGSLLLPQYLSCEDRLGTLYPLSSRLQEHVPRFRLSSHWPHPNVCISP